ncbi:MAG: hypothetical protein ACFE8L_13000 [Candidatus Hodarchaeota archaeon]
MKRKLKLTKPLIGAIFLISIITLVSTVSACFSNRILFMAKGDDLDIPGAKNIIIGSIKLGEDGELSSARGFFHSRIYDDSGEKVYAMMGMFKDGYVVDPNFSFFCPLFKVWFINVWQVMGQGIFRTTDTNIEVYFRDLLTITMPNTEGKFISANFLMLLSPAGEYQNGDPISGPIGPVDIWGDGGWALAAVIWYYPEIGDVLPVGPLSYLTISLGI